MVFNLPTPIIMTYSLLDNQKFGDLKIHFHCARRRGCWLMVEKTFLVRPSRWITSHSGHFLFVTTSQPTRVPARSDVLKSQNRSGEASRLKIPARFVEDEEEEDGEAEELNNAQTNIIKNNDAMADSDITWSNGMGYVTGRVPAECCAGTRRSRSMSGRFASNPCHTFSAI